MTLPTQDPPEMLHSYWQPLPSNATESGQSSSLLRPCAPPHTHDEPAHQLIRLPADAVPAPMEVASPPDEAAAVTTQPIATANKTASEERIGARGGGVYNLSDEDEDDEMRPSTLTAEVRLLDLQVRTRFTLQYT